MILLISIFLLWIFYAAGGFKKLMQAAEFKPDREPPKAPKPGPDHEKINRMQLEKAARDCLTAAGCKFNTYYYTRNKSDLELMEIIKDYNLNR